MSEENKASANAGSAEANGDGGSTNGGQTEVDMENYVTKAEYDHLFSKLGEVGSELGEYRKYFEQLTPILTKLDEMPELVEAITTGKIDRNVAKSVLEGKLSAAEAQAVTKAAEQVKKEAGSDLKGMTPAEMEKLVSDKVAAMLKETEDRVMREVGEVKTTREVEQHLSDFIAKTPDFSDYASDVKKFLDEHEDIWDVEVAYNAVKGRKITNDEIAKRESEAAELAKREALNMGGGSGSSSGRGGRMGIEDYIDMPTNANRF